MGTYGKNQGAIVVAFIHLFIQIAKSAIFCSVGFGDIPSICFVSELYTSTVDDVWVLMGTVKWLWYMCKIYIMYKVRAGLMKIRTRVRTIIMIIMKTCKAQIQSNDNNENL